MIVGLREPRSKDPKTTPLINASLPQARYPWDHNTYITVAETLDTQDHQNTYTQNAGSERAPAPNPFISPCASLLGEFTYKDLTKGSS